MGDLENDAVPVGEKNESELLERALEIESSGKRNLISENFIDAVSDLSEACQIFGELYGDASEKCATLQYSYGVALLGLAREENAVLGGAGDESSDEENQEATNGETPSEAAPATTEPDVTNGETEANPDETLNEDEDVSSLQLAWEVLDLARKTFESGYSDDNQESGRRLANTLRSLAEVAMESDNYPQAIEDLQRCLEIQVKILIPDDRALSETHFNMGSAYVCIGDAGKAIEEYKNSIDVLERRLGNLRKELEIPEKDEEAKKSTAEEVEELSKVVLDIQEKIEDTVEMKREAKETVERLKPQVEQQVLSAVIGDGAANGAETSFGFGESSSAFGKSSVASSSAKPLNVITSLKRKAPKSEDVAESEEKKGKVDA